MPDTVYWSLNEDDILVIENQTPDILPFDSDDPPASMWHLNDDNIIVNGLLPEPMPYGAFERSTIEYVSIPESVKYIGEYAFASTSLTSVKIASDCTYFTTSFPAGCQVTFYE